MNAKERFLVAHQLGASVTDAAKAAGVNRGTLYRWRDTDPVFAEAWRVARDKLVDGLEIEACIRAVEGNDRLLMFLLKSYRPQVFGKPEASRPGKSGQPQPPGITLSEIADRVSKWVESPPLPPPSADP